MAPTPGQIEAPGFVGRLEADVPGSDGEAAELVAGWCQPPFFEREPGVCGDGFYDFVDGSSVGQHVRGVVVCGERRDAAVDLCKGPGLAAAGEVAQT